MLKYSSHICLTIVVQIPLNIVMRKLYLQPADAPINGGQDRAAIDPDAFPALLMNERRADPCLCFINHGLT